MNLSEFYQLPHASHMTPPRTRVAFVEGDDVPRMGTLHHTDIHPSIGTTISIRPDVVRIANEVRRIDARQVKVAGAVAAFVERFPATRDLQLAKAIGISGASAKTLANDLHGIAWNWRTYGPRSQHPSAAMQATVLVKLYKWQCPTNPTVKAIFDEIKAEQVTPEAREIFDRIKDY